MNEVEEIRMCRITTITATLALIVSNHKRIERMLSKEVLPVLAGNGSRMLPLALYDLTPCIIRWVS